MPKPDRSWNIVFVLLATIVLTTASVRDLRADEAAELAKLKQRIDELEAQGKSADAIPLAEERLRRTELSFANQPTKVANALQTLASLYKDVRRYSEAEPLYNRSLKLRRQALGADHSTVGDSLYNLAGLYKSQKRYAESESHYQLALATYEKARGGEHADVADTLNSLANLYFDQKKYSDAEPLYQRSLKIREKVLGTENLEVAGSLRNLANLYFEQNRHAEAEPLYKRSLRIREKALGADNLKIVADLGALARLYQAQHRFAEAVPLYDRSLKIQEKALGPDHPDIANELMIVANLYFLVGRDAEVEPLLQRSLKISQKALGKDHPNVALVVASLANWYSTLGKHADAEPLAQRSLKIQEKAYGTDDPRIVLSVSMLAGIAAARNRLDEAEALYNRALKITENGLGVNDPAVANSLSDLADFYLQQGRYAESETLCLRAIRIAEKAQGADHPAVAIHVLRLAGLCSAQGKYAEAEPLYHRSLKLDELQYGNQHPVIANTLRHLGALYFSQHRYAEAESLIQRSLKINEKALGADHIQVAQSMISLADLFFEQGRHAEAEQLYKRASQIRQKALGSDNDDTACLVGLADLQASQGNYAESEQLIRQALNFAEQKFGAGTPFVADCLDKLVNLFYVQGRYAEAEPLADCVVSIRERAGVSPGDRSGAYLHRSSIAWKLNDRTSAFADVRQAMDLAEKQRGLASGTEHERAGMFTSYQAAFEQMIAWQFELGPAGDFGEVVAAIERSRARSLLDDLSMAGANLDLGRSAVERELLRQQEREVKVRAAELERQAAAAKTPAERDRLNAQLGEAREAVYQQANDQRTGNPIYRNLLSTAAGPPRLRQLQRTLTPDKTSVVLLYYLGEQAGYLVTVQSDQVHHTTLAVDQTEAKILACEPGPLTAARMQAILMNEAQTGVLQRLANPKTALDATPQLAVLWSVLIPERDRIQIQSGELKQLIIVPDGPLSSLPFEALVVNPGESSTYLLDVGPPVQYATSMTVLFNLRQRAPAKSDPQTKPVLTVANAVYKPAAATSDQALALLSPGTRYAQRGGHLQPLPFSGTEAAWVYDNYTKAGVGVGRLLQADATEANIRFNVPNRRIVHFACHGLVDQQYGNFFGSLAVTPGPKAKDDPTDDGFLTLAEIYQLDLKSCELAILSACETNFGPQQKGEGSWALSRGFLVAGARRVVASNWLVDDEAAANLVSYYCGGLASDEQKREVTHYATRLQSAKRWIRQQDKWSNPFFWAPFVLVGPD